MPTTQVKPAVRRFYPREMWSIRHMHALRAFTIEELAGFHHTSPNVIRAIVGLPAQPAE
jgi:hypothetical protein